MKGRGRREEDCCLDSMLLHSLTATKSDRHGQSMRRFESPGVSRICTAILLRELLKGGKSREFSHSPKAVEFLAYFFTIDRTL